MRGMQQLHGIKEKVRESKKPQETVRDMQQLHKIGETVRDSQQLKETVGNMQQLHGTGRDSGRQSATMRDSERNVETP